MSRSSFSKAYEEIANLEPMEMTFTIEDADLDKLNDVLKDINVKECPWFEVQDKHGNKAKYYRESRWISCSERLPEVGQEVICCCRADIIKVLKLDSDMDWYQDANHTYMNGFVTAWQPLPSPYREEAEEE